MKNEETIILTRSEVARLLPLEECIVAVERAFKLYAEGKATPPGILGIHAINGGFHIKAGLLQLEKNYFVAKINANFPDNREKYGLPTIQGVVVVSNPENGRLLAVMDSMELTIIRTGAATAVATKYLSNPEAKIATIWGCGEQGRISIKMLMQVRQLEHIYVFDIDHNLAEEFAKEFSSQFSIQVEAVTNPDESVGVSDICITCTSSKQPFLRQESVAPGMFIAAVGSDSEVKQEIEPTLLASSKLITDLTDQGATIGELHHAISEGIITRDHVHAELGEIIAGKKPGRTSPEEVIIFDSTGMALQDVASAAIVYEKALASEVGLQLDFSR